MNRALVCFALALSLAPAPAGARSFDDRVTRVIAYDSTETAMRRRIALAADQVCLDWGGPMPGPTVNLVCKNEAIRGAYAQLDTIQAHREPELAAADQR